MAEFRSMVLTEKGRALIAKMMAGTAQIKFTKIAASDETYTDEEITKLTAITTKQSNIVSNVIRQTDTVQVEGVISNEQLTLGYYINTIALYANDPTEGEILYAATGAEVPGYMPADNNKTKTGANFKLLVAVSNAQQVDIHCDPAAVATIGNIENLQKQINQVNSSLAGKTLWSGVCNQGDIITVPDIGSYTEFNIYFYQVALVARCFLVSGSLRGGAFYAQNGYALAYQMHASVSGNTLTLTYCNSITHTSSASHGTLTERAISKIVAIR